MTANTRDVIIAGGGIGGLVAAMSLHEVGIDAHVYESVDEIRPLGVGINLLPHAVRELDALGLLERLRERAVEPTTLAYFTKHGRTIWTEPRGIEAGYAWPQISIHRGVLHSTLLDASMERIGADRIHTGHHLESFSQDDGGVTAQYRDRRTGACVVVRGAALIACDGIHSVARHQFVPGEGMPKWNGATLWRGLIETEPILDGATMIWAGHPNQKFIAYPIENLEGGRQLVNFIAELRGDKTVLVEREDWNRPGVLADYLPAFERWSFDWIDVPSILTAAPGTFVFPMVDRDPIDRWSRGAVTLLGDAAHPMYPIGSNGASQAILDARVLAGCMRAYGNGNVVGALARYDEIRRPATSAIVLANRGMGPELPMRIVEERAPDGFDDIADVITPEEILEATDGYRRTAGFALAALSSPNAPSLIEQPRVGA